MNDDFVRSRPRQMDDVAQQDEVVRVLKKTLESKNVRLAPPVFVFILGLKDRITAATPPVLRPARHRQDVHRACTGTRAVRVRVCACVHVRDRVDLAALQGPN